MVVPTHIGRAKTQTMERGGWEEDGERRREKGGGGREGGGERGRFSKVLVMVIY